ncbi:MAG: hypothetical protein SAK29_06740 [Scytonema sp. PMC 1069.18]|nr:hypothetical protein [Scytonema sp. PMC 1069.18]MEC4885776.1 hypothetical protein [Scytonema sp. PMC 1070.18]
MVGVKQQKEKPLLSIKPSPSEKESLSKIAAGTAEGLWFFQDSQQQLELERHSVNAIAKSDDGIWVVDDFSSVWNRDLNGQWNQVGSVKDLRLNCILPLEGAILAGTSEAHLVLIADGNVKLLDSFEEVEGRSEWYTPWGGPPAVRSLAASVQNELYVNVHVGGILRSQDGGQSWVPTIDLHSDVHQVLTVSDRPNLVLAATAQGLAISKDRGHSWQFERNGLHATYSRAVAVCGNDVLISVSDGPHGDRAALYRLGLDDLGTFEKCQQGLPKWFSDNINTNNLVASANRAAFGTSEGDIFVSDDAGKTWKQIGTKLPPIQCLYLI